MWHEADGWQVKLPAGMQLPAFSLTKHEEQQWQAAHLMPSVRQVMVASSHQPTCGPWGGSCPAAA
jgi:hypothetical protein